MGLLSRPWLVSLLSFFFFSTFSKPFQDTLEKIKLHHSFLKDLRVLIVFLIESNLLKVVLLILTWSCTALSLACPLFPGDDEWVYCLTPTPFIMGRTPHQPLCTGHTGLLLLQNGRLIQPLDLGMALRRFRKSLSTPPQHQLQLQILSQPATSWLSFFYPLRSSL